MTPAQLAKELLLTAFVCAVWVGLVLLMLERDRKRNERRKCYRTADPLTEELVGPAPAGPPQNEEPRATAAQEGLPMPHQSTTEPEKGGPRRPVAADLVMMLCPSCDDEIRASANAYRPRCPKCGVLLEEDEQAVPA